MLKHVSSYPTTSIPVGQRGGEVRRNDVGNILVQLQENGPLK